MTTSNSEPLTTDEQVKTVRPRSCKCNPGDWFSTEIPPVCRRYEEDENHSICVRCEHRKECHRG